MRKIWSILRTDLRREFDSPATLIVFLVLPLVFTASVAAGLSGGTLSSGEVSIPLAIHQQDQGLLANIFTEALTANHLELKAVDTLPQDEFGLTLPADFSDRLTSQQAVTVTLQVNGRDNRAQAVQQAIEAAQERLRALVYMANLSTAQAEARGAFATEAERAAFFDNYLRQLADQTRTPAVKAQTTWASASSGEASSEATGSEQASAGQIVTWVQLTLLAISIVLVNERGWGTLRRLLVCPTHRAIILGGKLLFRFLLGCVQMGLLFVSGALLFGVEWGHDPLAVIAVSGAFALAMVGLGILLATLVQTAGQANSAATGLAMVMAAMGGAWWPLEITPPWYQQAVQVLPTTWAMRGYTDILARGGSLPEVVLETGVLFGFAVAFFAVGLVRFRKYT